MNDKTIYNSYFSENFCNKWKYLLKELYNYKFDNGFAIVRGFFGEKIYSYLPILSYTDLSYDTAKKLSSGFGNQNHQIRVLNFNHEIISVGEQVTLRIDFEDKSFEEVRNKFSNRLRRYLNNDDFYDFELERGNTSQQIESFYQIYQKIMHTHGSPALAKRTFFLLPDYFKSNFYVLKSKKTGRTISSACILKDENFSWIPWSGTLKNNKPLLAGHYLYYSIIKDSYESGDKFFDFGRSPFLSSNYEFKRRWGAIPVKIEIFTNRKSDIYNKYKYSSKVWKKIPLSVANLIGPRICKYLIDL